MTTPSHKSKSAHPVTNDWLRGIVTPLVTPLTREGRLDHPALERLIALQLEHGAHVFFVAGSVGEGPMLADDLRVRLIRSVVKLVAQRLPVVGGAMANSIAQGLDRLRELRDLGIRAGVLTLPYYGWTGQTPEAIEFFARLADRSPIPIIPYNLPRVTGRELTLDVMRFLFRHPNIAGMKNSGNDAAAMLSLIHAPDRPHRFRLLFGNSLLAGEMVRHGADGVVSVHSNLMPDLVRDWYLAASRKDSAKLAELQRIVTTLQEVLTLPNNSGGLKAAMEQRGICRRWVARPWPEAGPRDRQKIRAILRAAEIQYRKVCAKNDR